jgi:predicted GNAT superfamily acetyltransferase
MPDLPVPASVPAPATASVPAPAPALVTESETVAEAFGQARAAAATSGITVRQAGPRDLDAVIGLFERTWGAGRSPDRSMLQAIDHAGNTVLVATEAGKAVGAALGFLGWVDGVHLHSHMVAVVPWRRGAGVGYALKLFQRALCLEHGITEMRWTFDPLIRRNAHFNLVKLGAEVTAFRPDFYGRLDDAISGNDPSDRFEVSWRLDSARVRSALRGLPQPAWPAVESFALVADFERLRADDPLASARLRALAHDVFAHALERGLRPELDTANDYVFTASGTDAPARD